MNKLSRKRVAQSLVVAATMTLLAACGGGDTGSGAAADSGTVTFAAYGGTGQEAETNAWLDPFADETGITVVQDDPVTWAKVEQMVKAEKVTWDVVQGGISQGVEDNPLLEEIDCEVVDCAAFDATPYPAHPQAVPLFNFSYTVTYNKAAFEGKTPPTGFADFFDPTIEGKRNVMPTSSGWRGFLEAALLSDGVAREDLYPLDVERALSVVDKIKDQLVIMPNDDSCINDVASGEAIMGTCYNGRAGNAIKEGQPIEIAWGQQITYADYLYIPKGTPNLENAQKLIAHIVDNQGAIGNYIGYSGILSQGLDEGSEFAAFLPSVNALDGEQAPIVTDDAYWAEHLDENIEKVTLWASS